jgi:predicted MFS family arabinose efflux permease
LLLTGISETLSILLLARFVSGIASAFVLVFASALVLERLTASGDAVFASVHFGGVGVGITLSALMTSYLVGVSSSWQAMWYASAGLSAIALAATALLVPDWQRPRSQPTQQQSSSKSTGLVYLVISYGLFGFGYVITATFIVTLIRETPAIAQLENSIWIVFGLAAVPSVALWTWLASRFGLLPAFAVACLVEAVGVGASVLWVSLPGLVLAAILLGGTFMGLTALGLIAARTLATDSPRRALAAMTSAFGLGQIIGPALAGYLRDVTGSFYAPTLTAVGALVLAALLVMLMAKLVPCDTR